MRINFLGATEQITGSCYMLEDDLAPVRFLVDCGRYQGEIGEDQLNSVPFPFAASSIDFGLLTHAHFDHYGRLAQLWRDGFKGKIYCTSATVELASRTWRVRVRDLLGSRQNIWNVASSCDIVRRMSDHIRIDSFSCEGCRHVGRPNAGIETNDLDVEDDRRFVACHVCGARHEVGVTILDGKRIVELGRIFPEDVSAPIAHRARQL